MREPSGDGMQTRSDSTATLSFAESEPEDWGPVAAVAAAHGNSGGGGGGRLDSPAAGSPAARAAGGGGDNDGARFLRLVKQSIEEVWHKGLLRLPSPL